MSTTTPLVSVVIPTYNRPELLVLAVQSVLAQTFQNFEIIIVDDGESVETVVQEIKDPRITYIKNPKSLGGAGARNRGASLAHGTLIAFLDDDDLWVPEKLCIQVALLKQHPETGFCFCAVKNVYSDHEEDTHVPTGVHDLKQLSLTRFKGFLTSGLVVRKALFECVGGFDASFPSHQEAELMIRLAHASSGVGVDEVLVHMNLSHGGDRIGGNIQRRIKGREMILEKHATLFAQYPKIQALQYYRFFFLYRDGNKKNKARSTLLRAWTLHKNPLYLFRYGIFVIVGR